MSTECFSLVMKLSRALFLAYGLNAGGWPDFINLSELHTHNTVSGISRSFSLGSREKNPHNNRKPVRHISTLANAAVL